MRLREQNDMLRQQITALALFVEEVAASDDRHAEKARNLLRLVPRPDEPADDPEPE